MPHELAKTSLPPYVVEPPDVLLIDVIRVTPIYEVEAGTMGATRPLT